MRLISGDIGTIKPVLYEKLTRYRHHIFVERLGWALNCQSGMELDQFDRPDTLYVIALDNHGCVAGCARLLPTTRPYLLGEVFPQLFNGLPPPCSPDVWELSRFAAVDLGAASSVRPQQFSASIASKLLHESFECAVAHGAKRLISVSPVGVERLISRAGYDAQRAGPPMVIDGHPIFACWIDAPQ